MDFRCRERLRSSFPSLPVVLRPSRGRCVSTRGTSRTLQIPFTRCFRWVVASTKPATRSTGGMWMSSTWVSGRSRVSLSSSAWRRRHRIIDVMDWALASTSESSTWARRSESSTPPSWWVTTSSRNIASWLSTTMAPWCRSRLSRNRRLRTSCPFSPCWWTTKRTRCASCLVGSVRL